MEMVDLTIKVPKGTEEKVKVRAMEIIKDCITEQKIPETNAIQAEIDADFELVKEANGIVKEKEPKE